MAERDLPPPPHKTPPVGGDGMFSAPWSAFFRQLYFRVGGSSALTNAELAAASGSLPTGGTTGQYLKKTSATDFASAWTTLSLVNADIAAAAAIAVNKLAALTTSKVLVSDASGFLSASSVTSTTLAFLDATSSIQTQLDGKAIGVASAVDSEVALFSSTGGKQLKRATGTGFAKLTSGVLSAASSVALASDVSGTLSIGNGGTGQTTKAAAFDSLSPMTTSGDIIYGGTSGTGTRLAKGSDGQVLTLSLGVPSWATAGGAPTGSVIDYAGSSAPTGWLLCDGSAVSRTTYSALFTAISTQFGSGDGSTTFNLPDLRGRVTAGKDDMGGSTASRLTGGGSGITGTTLGASGGTETHILTTPQIPSHTHAGSGNGTGEFVYTRGGGAGVYAALGSGTAWDRTTNPVGSTGGGGAHQNTQPTMVLNKIIKT
jgi:microcystin-dependent protein